LRPCRYTANNIFCFAALADKHRLTVYTDDTRALSTISSEGHNHYLVAYNYNITYMFTKPISNVTDATIVN
jgi:hypothetical protein